jgi:hypothetical protein
MSNPFLLSNKNSALISIVDASANKSVYAYKTAALPTIAHERVSVSPNGGNEGLDQTITFDVPAYGLLSRIIFKFSVTVADGSSSSVNHVPGIIGLDLIDYIEISSQNRVISRQTRDMLMSKLAELTNAEQSNLVTAMQQIVAASNGTFTCYVPWMGMISGLDSSLSNVYDTSFTERLQVRVKVGAGGLLSDGAVSWGGSSCLFTFSTMKEEDMRALHMANYSAAPLVMLNSTAFTENTTSIAAAATTGTTDISCNGVVRRMLIRVNRSDESSSKNLEIATIVLNGSGRELIRFDGEELRLLGNGNWHHQPAEVSGVYENVYVIDFTVGKRLPGYSGGASFREIAAPSVQVTLASAVPSGKTAVLHVVHEQLELLSILGSNGRIQQSISS